MNPHYEHPKQIGMLQNYSNCLLSIQKALSILYQPENFTNPEVGKSHAIGFLRVY